MDLDDVLQPYVLHALPRRARRALIRGDLDVPVAISEHHERHSATIADCRGPALDDDLLANV
jgi:hypothetical protein